MPWVRLDEEYYLHPKLVAAGPLGMAMDTAALCYCNKYLTDGFVPRGVVPTLLNFEGLAMRTFDNDLFGAGQTADWTLVVEDLVRVGRWDQVQGGYRIHDFLDYQPSREAVIAEREAAKTRAANARAGKTVRDTFGKSSGEPRQNLALSVPVPVPRQDQDPAPAASENGWFETPNGWSDTEAHLFSKLLRADKEAWTPLKASAVNKLNREFGRPVVTTALGYALDSPNITGDPYPLLRAICLRVHDEAAAAVTSA